MGDEGEKKVIEIKENSDIEAISAETKPLEEYDTIDELVSDYYKIKQANSEENSVNGEDEEEIIYEGDNPADPEDRLDEEDKSSPEGKPSQEDKPSPEDNPTSEDKGASTDAEVNTNTKSSIELLEKIIGDKLVQPNVQDMTNTPPTPTPAPVYIHETSEKHLGLGIIFGIVCTIAVVIVIYSLHMNKVITEKIAKLEEAATKCTEEQVEKTAEIVFTDNGDLSAIADNVIPSIVSINAVERDYYNQTSPVVGSGIIINQTDDKLYIVTNNHIVEETERVSVQFVDGNSVSAIVNGSSTDYDVAVLTVNIKDIGEATLSAIKVANLNTDRTNLHVGNKVMAIGNALGYGQSITVGYISALNRSIGTSSGVRTGLIQTDAAINPGNSGGALVDMNGHVIGINVAKYSSVDAEGVGYSIPVADVSEILDLISSEKTPEGERGTLGITYRDIDLSTSTQTGMPMGILVVSITNEELKAAGLFEMDVIVGINGRPSKSGKALLNILSYYKTGSEVTLNVKRLINGKYEDIEVNTVLIEGKSTTTQTETQVQETKSEFDSWSEEDKAEAARIFKEYKDYINKSNGAISGDAQSIIQPSY